MLFQRRNVDADDLVARYLGGESTHALAKRYGVDRYVVRRVLQEGGIDPRGKQEAIALLPSLQIDSAAVEARYLAGESVKSLARSFGVSERPIARILRERGVALRGPADANRLMTERLTVDQHTARQAIWSEAWTKPHKAPSLPVASLVRQRSAALTRQRTLSRQMPDEILVLNMLPSGWYGPPQLAVERYNLDFSHGSVAVEVHSAVCHPLRPKTSASRAVDLADLGWHVVFFWISRFHPLSAAGIAELIAHAERLDRDPSPERQYVVIGGGGELISAGRLDPIERAIVPASVDAM